MGPGLPPRPGPIRFHPVALLRAPCETTLAPGLPAGKEARVDAQATDLTTALLHRHAERRWVPAVWSGLLIVILAFLVLYPTAMLLIGALTTTNPVVEGYHLADLSISNFLAVASNSNVG